MRVFFVAAVIPIGEAGRHCWIMRWAERNNFKFEMLYPIIGTPRVTELNSNLKAANMLYFSATPEDFKKYFGLDYTDDLLPKIPDLVLDKEIK
jgi:hypothetical protein